MTGLDYIYLLGLSALWGSSYLFIKIADEGPIPPAEMVLVRLIIATAVLYMVARLRGFRLPATRRIWGAFAVMGLVGTAAPFLLISWGETRIDSSLAAILNATVPIATVVLAHVWTGDERLSPARIAGILVGFAGVVVLVAGNPSVDGRSSALIGVAALLLSSLCYGIGNTFARRAFAGVPPVVAATGQMLLGGIYMLIPGGVAARDEHVLAPAGAWAAVAALALLGTVGAYLLYYQLIARVGATRTASTTYLLPAFATFYGAIFLHERLNLWVLAGFALILLGIGAVNGRVRAPVRSERSATVEATVACD